MSKSMKHKSLNYKQFKPMNLAPQGFTSMMNIDKIKEFVRKYATSEEVKKEVGSTQNIVSWLDSFKLEHIPKEAIKELVEMIASAEDKFKMALVDLLRLLITNEMTAAIVLNEDWDTLNACIIEYLKFDENQDLQNYHIVSLKMLINLYQTEQGKQFMQGDDSSNQIVDFCIFSFKSKSPKVVFHAAILLFNHILCWKRDL